MLPRRIELLAPARNLACGISAVNHGADAVYIGGPQFSARAAASNSLADIGKLVAYAHQYRARVYVALNTIFDDRELERAVALCHQLHGQGVDALIIQDVGLLESEMPPIPLHASTQMNNRKVEKVRFLEKVGFKQVVLARELSLAKIREIRAATSVPLEFFVHGALCVSYSGQCYISEVMAGRSANRGECAQFCRHGFSLKDGKGRLLVKDSHLLSLKDLHLAAHLGDLIEAGIDSFKIEGRLKDENYVKNITAYYRQALDTIINDDPGLRRSSSGSCSFDFIPDPSRSFNRGMTEYFLTDRRNRPGAIDSPKATGQRLGKVVHVERRYFLLQTDEVVNNGDGLCYFDRQNGLVGIKVNRVENGKIYPRDQVSCPVGATVYRNFDTAYNKLLIGSDGHRTIGVHLRLQETGYGLQLSIRDEDGIESLTGIKVEKAQARKSGSIATLAEKQLRKSGGSVFTIGDVKVNLDPNIFLPAAIFNDLRRQGFAAHLQERLQLYRVEAAELTINNFPWPASEVGYQDNIANRKAAAFYRRHGVARINRQSLLARDIADCALMTTKYCLKAQLNICPKMGSRGDDVPGPLTIVDKTGAYDLDFDCRCCEMTVRRSGAGK